MTSAGATIFGSQATYECNLGTWFRRGVFSTISTCTEAGTWDLPPSLCIRTLWRLHNEIKLKRNSFKTVPEAVLKLFRFDVRTPLDVLHRLMVSNVQFKYIRNFSSVHFLFTALRLSCTYFTLACRFFLMCLPFCGSQYLMSCCFIFSELSLAIIKVLSLSSG